MSSDRVRSGVLLAELVGALSLATDLGLGQPQEHVLRQTLIAQRIAAAADASEADRAAVFYVSLLAWVGCLADSHELASWFGDDRRMRAESYQVDMAGLPLMRLMLGNVGHGAPPLRRLTMIGRFLAGGFKEVGGGMVGHCQTTGDVAERLGLPAPVRESLRQSFERWDGKGVPEGLSGEQIELTMRIAHIADDVEVFLRVGGASAAIEMLQRRRDSEFDPVLVDLVCEQAPELFDDISDMELWPSIVSSPGVDQTPLAPGALTDALRVLGDYADLKSPTRLGHSRGVAELATAAAGHLGLSVEDVTLVERAALVHDIGISGVSTGIWDKPGPLTDSEREHVRTHPYLTGRVLARPADLGVIGAVAALHHERLDGSGYPHGLRADALPMTARILAAADVRNALGQARPHRPAYRADDAASILRAERDAGRLDADAVDAVLSAAGHHVPTRRSRRPGGLTDREVQVLVLLARGETNKQIAAQLGVSAKTVGSHVEHVYLKIGVSTRGAAAMFAMRHGLVDIDVEPSGIG